MCKTKIIVNKEDINKKITDKKGGIWQLFNGNLKEFFQKNGTNNYLSLSKDYKPNKMEIK